MQDKDLQIDREIWYTDPLTEKTYRADLVQMVDDLLLKIRKKPLWEVVDFCIEIWARKYPKKHKEYLDAVKEIKSSRRKATASSKTNQTRYLAEPPWEVMMLLEKVAQHKIDDYGKQKFWRKFAKRYPGFSVAEKV